MDKEMEQLFIESMKGAKYVDKLAKVYLKDGSEEWILVHIEVQGYPDKEFSLRMFRYFYRIFDRYGKRIVSIALLTTSEKGTGEGKYESNYETGFIFFSHRLTQKNTEKEKRNSVSIL